MAKRVVLIGHPVTHSLAEALQQAAFDARGIAATFEAIDTPLIELPGRIDALRKGDDLGAAITVPHKERVAPMVDRLTEEAQATGAVDTITREGSRLVGHNTDVLGFRPALDALVGNQKMPRSAVVLGAGGGARATVYSLITAGFQHVVVFNRHLHRAEGLVRHFARSAAHMELRAKPWHESVIEAEISRTQVLINASSVGRDPEVSPISAELLAPELLLLDLHYLPAETRLMRDARAAGAANVMNGDVMLLNQTAAAFELWTGESAPRDVVGARLEEVRARPDLLLQPAPAEAPSAADPMAAADPIAAADPTAAGNAA
jgi:shikimate dehydrogenase